MIYINYFIPLLEVFLSIFFDLFLLPMICLCFIATVPFIIRIIFKR